MEQELVLAFAAALGVLFGGWIFLTPLKKPIHTMTPKAKTGFYFLAIFLIALGVVNLWSGFLKGEILVSGKYGGYVGWMSYDGHKRAFAWFGFLYSFMIAAGLGIIRMNLLTGTEK